MDDPSRAKAGTRLIWSDALCLVLITLLSAMPYVAKLGFYSDDWYVLYSFHAETVRHSFGIQSALHYDEARPVQGLYLALLYQLFGFHPFGYHLVNTAVIAAAMPLLYWLLVRVDIDRPSALGASIALIVLPQLSTVRVWFLTVQIPLSMLMTLVSLHCQLSFARTGRAGWAFAAAATAIVSIAAYEIFAPMIAAFPIALLAARWQKSFRQPAQSRRAIALLALVLLVGLLTLAKYAVSVRAQPPDLHRYVKGLIQLVRPDYDWRTDYALNIFAALDVHFWWTIVGWFRGAEALAQERLGWFDGAVALAVALLSFWRIRLTGGPAARPWSSRRLLLLGIAVFVLGHAVFLIAPAMNFSPAGIANRALVAAAVGVALILVATLRHLVALLEAKRQSLVFASAIGITALLGTLRIEQIASYWTEAPAIQGKVLAAARSDLKGIPPRSFVMLDNVCPYHGPAVIFEAPWDVSGALSLTTGKEIRADAVSPRMTLRPNGLATSIYGEPAFYPFGRDLYVYDPARHLVAQLGDLAAARHYFVEANRSRTVCPQSYVGHGELI